MKLTHATQVLFVFVSCPELKRLNRLGGGHGRQVHDN
jgi:hypothetical protein